MAIFNVKTRLAAGLSVLALSLLGVVGVSTPAMAIPCPSTVAGVTNGTSGSDHIFYCDFRGWDFTSRTSGNPLQYIDFQSSYFGPDPSTLAATNFNGATLNFVKFGNQASDSVNFRGAHISNSTFYLASMANSDFTGAIFTGTTLHDAHFENSNFQNADFVGANFLSVVWLGGANLTGSNVTQAQLDNANLTSTTVCPDAYQLGVHVGNCFSALKALPPILSPITAVSGGFTFDVINYNELYTFTATITAGPGIATIGSPTGANLPITVSNVPQGSQVSVTVTSDIGGVTASTSTHYPADLAPTGVDANSMTILGATGVVAILAGFVALYFRRRRNH